MQSKMGGCSIAPAVPTGTGGESGIEPNWEHHEPWRKPPKLRAPGNCLPLSIASQRIVRQTHCSHPEGLRSTPRGFEPLRAEPNGFRVHLLNRSDTMSLVWEPLNIDGHGAVRCVCNDWITHRRPLTGASISGLVVEYIVAIDVTRVRFPADAHVCG